MRLLRRSIGVALTAVGIGMTAAPASAGGSVFLFPRDSYLPGQTAVGVSEDVSIRIRSTATPADGPFYAYLVRTRDIREHFDPSRGVEVGVVAFTKTRPGFVTARIAFRVPDVPHGSYMIGMCNRPCTESWVGDLVGGWFFVGTPLEYRVLELTGRIEGHRQALGRQGRRIEKLEAELRSGMADLRSNVDERLAGLNRRMAASHRDEGRISPWLVSGWATAVLLALVLAAQTVRGRRIRRGAPRLRDGSPHPDFDRAAR